MSGAIVSVVIPTHNRADMVGDAIESVLRQSLPDPEIIVVDDGSTDDTETRVRGYGERVRYIRTENGGVAHARNVGMRHASGRYLTFLDSDDTLYPYALELEAALLDRYPDIALVCAEMSGVGENGLIGRYYLQTYHRSAYRKPGNTYDRIFSSAVALRDAVPLPGALLREDAAAGDRKAHFGNVFDTYLLDLVLCQNSVMFRRSMLRECGERNIAVKQWEEVDYLLRITRRHPICFADVPTYKMRFHSGQISTTEQPNGLYVWMRKQQILLRVIKRHALADGDYYAKNRRRIDSHLAHLHRAVAVPMLLQGGSLRARKRAARFALRYLARCARYGRPARILQIAAHAPAPIRSMAVKVVESCRQAGRSLMWSAERHLTRTHATLRPR